MQFHQLFFGGGLSFCAVGGQGVEVPCFTFNTRDLSRTREFFRGMYVDLSVRLRPGGGLAYCLDLPDRSVEPWSIPVAGPELDRLRREAALFDSCPTRVRDPEGACLDLMPFVAGLKHDWSGRVAQGLSALGREETDLAAGLFRQVADENPCAIPAAHHLLGRCLRICERLDEAVGCYHAAVRAAASPSGDLVPFCAGPLSDMGVAFKKKGDAARAVHCFLHSLHLRPNHPEALLTFFSLFATDDKLVVYGAARVLAVGGRPEMVMQYLANYGAFAGSDPALLLALATNLAGRMDLTRWPLGRKDFGRLDAFERGLDSPPPAPSQPERCRIGSEPSVLEYAVAFRKKGIA